MNRKSAFASLKNNIKPEATGLLHPKTGIKTLQAETGRNKKAVTAPGETTQGEF